ncbi:MAG: PRC-barrel domain-containing protein [Candidatus Poseidoniaceae archaeon]|mgnify:CR=1 FL=1|tara:strand:+ start:1413 stop:1652 length:240 start_codon:yes stop_codon:yes gene_type:complete
MAIFAAEIIGREVVDSHLERLGELKDVVFDTPTGSIVALRVEIERDLDASKLPWNVVDGFVQIPVEDINRVAAKIHLKR